MRIINEAYKATTTGLQCRYIPLSRFWGEQRDHNNEEASVIERANELEHRQH